MKQQILNLIDERIQSLQKAIDAGKRVGNPISVIAPMGAQQMTLIELRGAIEKLGEQAAFEPCTLEPTSHFGEW